MARKHVYTEEFYSDVKKVKQYLKNNRDKHGEATIRKHMKNHLIAINGNKCSICGGEHWLNGNMPLVCDHIDGDPENSSYKNFRLVCGNCDMLLPTYKRGKGRANRRKNSV